MNRFHILIPCKNFAAGKSRLSAVLRADERERLCRRLLARTTEVALAAAGAGQVTVVSADADVLASAARLGAHPLAEVGHGLNEALSTANERLLDATGARTTLVVLPTDLPLVTAPVLTQTVGRTARIGIAPDADGSGTNLLVIMSEIRPGFPFAFGPRSFECHLATASRLGIDATILREPSLAFDLDRPEELSVLRKHDSPLHSDPIV